MICMNTQERGHSENGTWAVRLVAHPGLGRQGRQAKGTSRWSGDIGNYMATPIPPKHTGESHQNQHASAASETGTPRKRRFHEFSGQCSLRCADWATSQRLGGGPQRVGRNFKTKGKGCRMLWTKTFNYAKVFRLHFFNYVKMCHCFILPA